MTTDDSHDGSDSQCRLSDQISANTENVGSDFLYQAAPSTDSFPVFAASSEAHRVTSENSPNKSGVVRWIAKSDHWRWVSTPRWRRASSKVASPAHRIAYQVRISDADLCGSEQTKTRVSARPAGSRVSTQRTGRVMPRAFHRAVPVATSTGRSVVPSSARHPGMVMRTHLVAFLTDRVLGVS